MPFIQSLFPNTEFWKPDQTPMLVTSPPIILTRQTNTTCFHYTQTYQSNKTQKTFMHKETHYTAYKWSHPIGSWTLTITKNTRITEKTNLNVIQHHFIHSDNTQTLEHRKAQLPIQICNTEQRIKGEIERDEIIRRGANAMGRRKQVPRWPWLWRNENQWVRKAKKGRWNQWALYGGSEGKTEGGPLLPGMCVCKSGWSQRLSEGDTWLATLSSLRCKPSV